MTLNDGFAQITSELKGMEQMLDGMTSRVHDTLLRISGRFGDLEADKALLLRYVRADVALQRVHMDDDREQAAWREFAEAERAVFSSGLLEGDDHGE